MTSIATEQLKEQLEQAQVELIECLRNGADTAPIRVTISRLEGELSQALVAEHAAVCAQAAEEAKAICEQATSIATSAQANIQACTEVQGLAALAGDQLPAVPRDPAVETAAARVAAAQAVLAKAETAEKPLKDEAVRLSQRLSSKRAAVDKIRTRRAAGDEQLSDATELGLLLTDIEGLEPMVVEAQRAARAAEPENEHRALQEAIDSLSLAEQRAVFSAAHDRVLQAEQVLLKAHQALVAAGAAVGERNPLALFRASNELRRITFGITGF